MLATLLAYVGSTGDPVKGGSLLLAYTSGYVVSPLIHAGSAYAPNGPPLTRRPLPTQAPLLAAATFTGAMKDIVGLRKYSAWITPASGAMLVAGGTYALLSRLVDS